MNNKTGSLAWVPEKLVAMSKNEIKGLGHKTSPLYIF